MGAKHQNLLLAKMPLASAFTSTCNISSALAPLSRKNSFSQHFFIQKSKTCHETVELTSQWGKNTKNYSWATMPLASAFRPICNISSALAPLSTKNSLSQHFFIQKSKTCHKTVEFTSQLGQNTKTYSWQKCPWQVPLRPHASFLQPWPRYREKIRSVSIFSYKNQKLVMKPLNWRVNGGKTPKTTPGQQCPWQVPSGPYATFLQPLAPLSRRNSLSQHFFMQKSKICHEIVEFTSQWGQNTKTYSWQQCPWQVPSGPYATFLQP